MDGMVLFKRWRAWQRRRDIEVLWPLYRAKQPSLLQARKIFMYRLLRDPRWIEVSKRDIWTQVKRLT